MTRNSYQICTQRSKVRYFHFVFLDEGTAKALRKEGRAVEPLLGIFAREDDRKRPALEVSKGKDDVYLIDHLSGSMLEARPQTFVAATTSEASRLAPPR
jgi:hypothetical protein